MKIDVEDGLRKGEKSSGQSSPPMLRVPTFDYEMGTSSTFALLIDPIGTLFC